MWLVMCRDTHVVTRVFIGDKLELISHGKLHFCVDTLIIGKRLLSYTMLGVHIQNGGVTDFYGGGAGVQPEGSRRGRSRTS